jgi:hypothetical protein
VKPGPVENEQVSNARGLRMTTNHMQAVIWAWYWMLKAGLPVKLAGTSAGGVYSAGVQYTSSNCIYSSFNWLAASCADCTR